MIFRVARHMLIFCFDATMPLDAAVMPRLMIFADAFDAMPLFYRRFATTPFADHAADAAFDERLTFIDATRHYAAYYVYLHLPFRRCAALLMLMFTRAFDV